MPLLLSLASVPSYEHRMNTPTIDLNDRFVHELQSVHDDMRSQAALSAFRRLRPTNETTVEQFLGQLQGHKDMWAVVGTLGIVDFAATVARHPAAAAVEARPRRTRINDEQKDGLKRAILRVFEDHGAGMNRSELSAALVAGGLVPQGIEPAAVAEKVRQPLSTRCRERNGFTQVPQPR